MTQYRLSDFDYELPQDLIAQSPAERRSDSRLLVVPRQGDFEDRQFAELPNLLKAGDLLVFNDSKVIPARLHAVKTTGGQVEILVERVTAANEALVLLKASKKPKAGAVLELTRHGQPGRSVRLVGRDASQPDRFMIDFHGPVFEILETYGEIPLPPYIDHQPGQQDVDRYQTIYAQHPGSVAAPTAGLHFDSNLFALFASAGIETARVTLHVGSGTFAPVKTEDLSHHVMHSEWCSIDEQAAEQIARAKREGRRIIAVGTTSLRTLESAAQRIGQEANRANSPASSLQGISANRLAGRWDTNLFITPGYEFKLVDGLVTNFHLPKSTLLMLISALMGYDRIRQAYQHAIAQRYRFFSYGDACLFI